MEIFYVILNVYENENNLIEFMLLIIIMVLIIIVMNKIFWSMFYDGIVQILFNECLNVFDVLIKNYLLCKI